MTDEEKLLKIEQIINLYKDGNITDEEAINKIALTIFPTESTFASQFENGV